MSTPGPVTQEVGSDLLALLRALQFLHWTAHWQSSGVGFYSDHTLFERLYGGLSEEFDSLAEKLVGYFGAEVVAPTGSMVRVTRRIGSWMGSEPIVTASHALRAEEELQRFLGTAYTAIDEAGEMTLGLDDFLMGLAHDHETNLYLLRQAVMGRTAAALDGDGQPDMSAEGHFFDKPRAREVREFAESGAKTNVDEISTIAVAESHGGIDGGLRGAPPTPDEVIRDTPGSSEFSSLSRYLIQTEQPTDPGVPMSRDDIPKHPDLIKNAFAGWTFSRHASLVHLDQVRKAVAHAYQEAWGNTIRPQTLHEAVMLPESTRRSGEDGIEGSLVVIFTEYPGLSQYDNQDFWRALEKGLDAHRLYYELVDGGTATIWPD